MATINATLPTLQDIVSRMNPDGSFSEIVEILTQQNAILQDAVWVEGNLPTGHQFTSRRALPSGTWRRFNEGVAVSKTRTEQVVETCGMLTALAKVDSKLASVGGNAAAYRASEERGYLQGLSNDLETALIYSSTKTDPEKILGFAPRLDSTTGNWGGQIINSQIAHSGSDQSSMWLVVWGPNTVHGIFPKGSKGGLEVKDRGEELTRDASNNEFYSYVTEYCWNVGLCVRDARYLVRLANLDTSAIAETGSLLIQDMIKMVHQAQDLTSGRPAIYCNRKIATYLHLQALDSTKNSTLAIQNIGGQPVTTFLGIPVRMSDAITNTEAVIS
jgi:hypothetical protein